MNENFAIKHPHMHKSLFKFKTKDHEIHQEEKCWEKSQKSSCKILNGKVKITKKDSQKSSGFKFQIKIKQRKKEAGKAYEEKDANQK